MKWMRRAVRFCALLLAIGCACSGSVKGVQIPYGIVPATSLFVAAVAVAARVASLFMLGAAGVGLATLIWPRLFCRWLCPLGTCQTSALALYQLKWRRPWIAKLPAFGRWILWLSVGGALVGYPFFLWLDPLVLFTASAGAVHTRMTSLDYFWAAVVPLFMVTAMLFPGLWCAKLCPLGGAQDVVAELRHGALALIRCVRRRENAAPRVGLDAGRRLFLGIGVGAGVRCLVSVSMGIKKPVLRPPMARPNDQFVRLCARCGACVKACPSHLIRYGGTGSGFASVLAAEVSLDRRSCPPTCVACGSVCPTGAIEHFTAKTKFERPMGTAEVEHDYCRMAQGGGCGICIMACPHRALRRVYNREEDRYEIAVVRERCTGCGACIFVCPTEVIAVVPPQAGAHRVKK